MLADYLVTSYERVTDEGNLLYAHVEGPGRKLQPERVVWPRKGQGGGETDVREPCTLSIQSMGRRDRWRGKFHWIAIFNGLIFEQPGRWYSACLEKSQNKTFRHRHAEL